MKIAVAGLWHLGTVTAACLAAEGHDVVALDEPKVVAEIEAGRLPVEEPGLGELIAAQSAAGRLVFRADAEAAAHAELVWICYDTPIDDADRPDVDRVLERATNLLSALPGGAVVAVSSQLPVGSVAELEHRLGGRFAFAAVPENLRLGSAIAYFRSPDRFVVGTREPRALETIQRALRAFAPAIVAMNVESAEMTKHAINAFLATSVVFANELAAICERTDADARDVERGLKSDLRIGPKAYVRAGEAFAGGTLARDLIFLAALAGRTGVPVQQIRATAASNSQHRNWTYERVREALRDVPSPRVALLGLVYKPGTDTLRGSNAVALAHRLRADGVALVAYDPAIAAGDGRLAGIAELVPSAAAALAGADAAVISTGWPAFREIPPAVFEMMRRRIVVDQARFLEESLGATTALQYVAFGRGAGAAEVSE